LPPTIVNWVFIGWRIGDSMYNAGDVVIIDTDTTVTAVWTQAEPLSYTVVYNGNGGRGTMAPQTGVSGDFILPNCGYTAPTGKQFKAYYVNGVYYQPGDVIDVKANTVVWIYWKNAPADVTSGVTVSGTVTSGGSDTDDIYLQLIAEGFSEADYEVVVQGNNAAYSIEGVAAGTYTLKVIKKGHIVGTYTVVVGEEGVTQDVTLYLLGDVNLDGNVDLNDATALFYHINGLAALDGNKLLAADVNGDGKVDLNDATALFYFLNGLSSEL